MKYNNETNFLATLATNTFNVFCFLCGSAASAAIESTNIFEEFTVDLLKKVIWMYCSGCALNLCVPGTEKNVGIVLLKLTFLMSYSRIGINFTLNYLKGSARLIPAIIGIECTGRILNNLEVQGMEVFKVILLQMVFWMCYSGHAPRIVWMHENLKTLLEAVILICCSGCALWILPVPDM